MHAKEPHPQAEYLNANHDQLVGLIDLSHELLLRHEPVVSVMAEAAQLPAISIWGRELSSYDPDTLEGTEAISRAQEARRQLATFSTQVTLRLIASEADARGVGVPSPEAVQYMVTSDQARRLMQVVNASGRTFAALLFEQANTGQLVAVETVTMHGASAPLARGLTLRIDDDQLSRNVLVGHMEQPPVPVDPPLWVAQSIGPAWDNDIQRIVEFFLRDHDDHAGYSAIFEVFQRGIRGHTAGDLVAGLQERYPPAEREQIAAFAGIMQRRAEAAYEHCRLIMQNPELVQPSPTELDDYTQLLRSLLG